MRERQRRQGSGLWLAFGSAIDFPLFFFHLCECVKEHICVKIHTEREGERVDRGQTTEKIEGREKKERERRHENNTRKRGESPMLRWRLGTLGKKETMKKEKTNKGFQHL